MLLCIIFIMYFFAYFIVYIILLCNLSETYFFWRETDEKRPQWILALVHAKLQPAANQQTRCFSFVRKVSPFVSYCMKAISMFRLPRCARYDTLTLFLVLHLNFRYLQVFCAHRDQAEAHNSSCKINVPVDVIFETWGTPIKAAAIAVSNAFQILI